MYRCTFILLVTLNEYFHFILEVYFKYIESCMYCSFEVFVAIDTLMERLFWLLKISLDNLW